MPGLTSVVEMIGRIGAAGKLAAADLREATTAAKEYRKEAEAAARTTSGMPGAGAGTSTVGASASSGADSSRGAAVTPNSLKAALKITQGRP